MSDPGRSFVGVVTGLALDARQAARAILQRRLLVFLAALTLGVGIASNVTLFSFFNGIYLRPLPYPEPSRLVAVAGVQETTGRRAGVSPDDLLDLRAGVAGLEVLAGYRSRVMNLTGLERPERLSVVSLTPGGLRALGVRPVAGRLFRAEEGEARSSPVVILSHRLWTTSFGGAEVLGRTLRLDGEAHTVVGVLPPDFSLLRHRPDLFVAERVTAGGGRAHRGFDVIGRLEAGASWTRAAAEVERVGRELATAFPESHEGWALEMVPLRREVLPSRDLERLVPVMMTAVGLVLLVACANVGSLLLARATARRRELTIRAALGAGRRRLSFHLLAESGLLAALGGVLGLVLTVAGVRAILAVTPAGGLTLFDFGVDYRLLLFTAAVCVSSTLLAGWVPVAQVFGSDLASSMRSGGLASDHGRWSRVLVVTEITFAFILLVAASVVLHGLDQMHRRDLGIEPENVMTLRLDPPASKYPGGESLERFYDAVEERLRALPGVLAVGATNDLTLTGSDTVAGVRVVGEEARGEGGAVEVSLRTVSPGYFEALGAPMAEGRGPRPADAADGEPVAVVNEAFARRFGGGKPILGRSLAVWGKDRRVVGVVRDFYEVRLDRPLAPVIYLPSDQAALRARSLAVRLAGGGAAEAIRRAVWEVDPEQPIALLRPLPEIVSRQAWVFKTMTGLLAVFAGLAWVLAAVGIYSVTAYGVGQRTPEIGLRMALGAGRGRVLRLLLGEGIRRSLWGIAIGWPLAYLATRGLASLFFGVSVAGWQVFLTMTLLIVLTTLVACAQPAWRAATVDPNKILRYS